MFGRHVPSELPFTVLFYHDHINYCLIHHDILIDLRHLLCKMHHCERTTPCVASYLAPALWLQASLLNPGKGLPHECQFVQSVNSLKISSFHMQISGS